MEPEEEELYVFRLAEHFERMHRSCRILRITLPYTVDELVEITLDLLRREGYRQDTYIRPLAFKGDEIIGVRLHDLTDEFAMFAVPFGRYIEKEEGAHVCISAWRRVDDNAVPARAKITGAYINSALAKTDAVLDGYDEALVLTQDGHISEGSAENFFIVRNGQLDHPAGQLQYPGRHHARHSHRAGPGRDGAGDSRALHRSQRSLCLRRGLFLRHGCAGSSHHPGGTPAHRHGHHRPGGQPPARALF